MKFDNYMDPRKTFGKAVTQEAERSVLGSMLMDRSGLV